MDQHEPGSRRSFLKGRFIRWASAAVLATAGIVNAHASILAADGAWQAFDVSEALAVSGGKEWIDINDGTALSFTFTIDFGRTALLTVVDTGFAGDTFNVFNGVNLLGATSAVAPVVFDPSLSAIVDPDAALADPSFSRATFLLEAGSYSINGILDQSVLLDVGGEPLNSTSGGIRLTAVPEPGSLGLLLAGLGLIGYRARRRG